MENVYADTFFVDLNGQVATSKEGKSNLNNTYEINLNKYCNGTCSVEL